MACLNPNSARTPCACPACQEEKNNVSRMRNQVIYSGVPGSIVEWTLSEEWTKPHDSATKSKRGTWHTAHDVYWDNEVKGEIYRPDDSLGFSKALREIDQKPWGEIEKENNVL